MTSKDLTQRLIRNTEKLRIIAAALDDYNYGNMARIIREIRSDLDFTIAELNTKTEGTVDGHSDLN